jgi:hypothetical protein
LLGAGSVEVQQKQEPWLLQLPVKFPQTPAVHWELEHEPSSQTPEEQTLPQEPQLLGSVRRSVEQGGGLDEVEEAAAVEDVEITVTVTSWVAVIMVTCRSQSSFMLLRIYKSCEYIKPRQIE